MELTRRGFVILGVGLATAGCVSTPQRPPYRASQSNWPPPAPPRPVPQQTVRSPVRPAPAPTVAAGKLPVDALARSQWAKAGPIMARVNPLGAVNRITVHHEGSNPVWFADVNATKARLEVIRQQHVQRGWADIGYHFVIDRGGRVWAGRDLRYQGAHVKENNENNIGIMVLGNFDRQAPTSVQINTLRNTLSALMRHYRVPANRVFTHQELMPTACPGKSLQPQIVALRRRGALA